MSKRVIFDKPIEIKNGDILILENVNDTGGTVDVKVIDKTGIKLVPFRTETPE